MESKENSHNGKQLFFILIGLVFISVSVYYFNKSNNYINDDPFKSLDKKYVGGDAYNYIIAASYASTFMLKSLWHLLLGTCLILFSKKYKTT